MSEPESRPKHIRKPSSRLRLAQGMDTDSDDDNDDFTPAQQLDMPPIPPMPEATSLERSQSTASLTSQASGAVSTTTTAEEARRAKFDARFNTATSTNEEVLGRFYYLFNKNIFSSFRREADGYVDLAGLPTFQNATCHRPQEGSCCIHLYLHSVCTSV